jgi:hypothetical protein
MLLEERGQGASGTQGWAAAPSYVAAEFSIRLPHQALRVAVTALMEWLCRIFQHTPGQADPKVAEMPIPLDRLAALRPDDQFIVSYPRSGNTWMRHLVRDVIVLSRPEEAEPESVWMLVPDLHIPGHEMEHPAQRRFGMHRRILKSHNLALLGEYRLLYLFRAPADALVSYYHFHRLEEALRPLVEGGIEPFCELMIEGWCEHVELALSRRERAPGEILLLSYEDLTADGPATLGLAAQFLGLSADPQIHAAALERNAFARLREKEEMKRTGDEFFFRRGKVGAAREELPPAMLEKIEKRAGPVYQRARERSAASRNSLAR